MDHQPLSSSNIASTAWENNTLQVKFRNGSTYQYRDVPEAVHRELRNADSAGKYFAANIRGKFPHTKIGGGGP